MWLGPAAASSRAASAASSGDPAGRPTRWRLQVKLAGSYAQMQKAVRGVFMASALYYQHCTVLLYLYRLGKPSVASIALLEKFLCTDLQSAAFQR